MDREEKTGPEAASGPAAGATTAARRKWWAAAAMAVGVLLLAGLWVAWRYTAPVKVEFVADIGDLPFTVEAIPPVVYVRPGEIVSITYRIRNNDITPISAFGRLTFTPGGAEEQMYIYITQCGGLNTYQNAYVDDYDVVFKVEPAGLLGSGHVVVEHVFTRSSPR